MDEITKRGIRILAAFLQVLGSVVIVMGLLVFLGYVTLPIFTQTILIIALGILITLIKVEEKETE